MHEKPSFEKALSPEDKKQKREAIRNAVESLASNEKIAFPGLRAGVFVKEQANVADNNEDFSEVAVLLRRCKEEGIKIIFDGSTASFVPAETDEENINYDTIRLYNLSDDGVSEELRSLIELCRDIAR